MFNFTTETILNDLTKVKYLIGGLAANGNATPFDPGVEATKPVLYIERLAKFIAAGTVDYIKDQKVYKRAATAAVQATRYITIPTVTSGALYRLGVQITTNGYADGQFARDRVLYGKPFYVEVVATATTDTTLAGLFVTAWNTAFASYDNFPIASLSTANVVLTSDNNPFIQFKSLTLESINTTTGVGTDLLATVSAGTPGTPAFGDYTNLLKNHRLPTVDNFRPYGLNQDELPVVGATYDQYTFKYVTGRGSMGQSVVGQNAASVTTHVIWVKVGTAEVVRHTDLGTTGQTGSYSFEEMLNAVGLTLWDPETGLEITITPATES